MHGTTGFMMSILAGKANSFKTEVAFSADILIGLRRSFVPKKYLMSKRATIIIITIPLRIMSGEKKPSLQEVLDLFQNIPSEISNVLTYDFSDEDVPANNLREGSLDSLDDDQETEQDSRCSSSC
ncbi:hypothetical protein TNCV_3101851 [Trichonephila clavipes]|nr:hypothetical protein TNCV_3101851 [Trichonephila clavipes]